jgi:hypothetical protein
MPFIKTFFTLLILLKTAWAIENLPELITKQNVNNLRYVSADGKMTYYQSKKGVLKLSTNYEFRTILKTSAFSQFEITKSDNSNYILISEQERPHRENWILKNNNIYISELKSDKAVKIGEGQAPRLHLEDRFITFYDQLKREIIIKHRENLVSEKRIQGIAINNPYFTPEVYMVTPTDILYTDINKSGFTAVLMYSTVEKKFETVYKSKWPGQKFDLCYVNNSLIIGEFPLNKFGSQTSIIKMDLFNNPTYSKTKVLYTSPLADIGNMVCDKDILYFIKTMSYQEKIGYKVTEVNSLNLKTLSVQQKTKLKNITQITKMGDLILAIYNGKYYIIKGNTNLIDDGLKEKAK